MSRSGGPRQDSQDALEVDLVYAIVTDNKDVEKKGRVRCQLKTHGDSDQMWWAQVVVPMEGDKFGWYVLPDIDDVVVMMFVKGDHSNPVVLGGIWSKVDISPEPNEDGKNNFRGYRSRSGHRLILDDSAKTKIVVADKTGKNMFGIGNFDKEGAGPNVCAIYKPPMAGTTGISFTTLEGKMEITCKDGKLSIEAEQNIKFNIIETFDMNAGKDVTLTAKSGAKMTSASDSSYDGPTIKIN